MAVDVIVGLQRGDEGKGRFVDMLAADYDIVARFNGGNNAGHTVVLPDDRVLKLHLVPSGITHPHVTNVIGNGTYIHPEKLVEELLDIEDKGIEVTEDNLKISSGAHLILPHHIYEDELREASEARQGSTKSGISPVAQFKVGRFGARPEMINNEPEELLTMVYEGLHKQRELRAIAGIEAIDEMAVAREYVAAAKRLGSFLTDTAMYLNNELRKDKPARVLAEGAQAFQLDIDHGMYSFVTSSSTISGGVSPGLGVAPTYIRKITGVAKAVQSHVGGGPFVTEVTDPELLTNLHGDMNTVDAERGTTTGRTRRLGYLDLPGIRRANMINGTADVVLTKLDWVPRYGGEIPVCVSYERKGKTLDIAPDSARKLGQCTPNYEKLPSWEEDIQSVRRFEDLPENAQRYVRFIEEQIETPISMIGVGPKRDQVIVRQTRLTP